MEKINRRYLLAFGILFLIEAFIALFVHDSFIRPLVGDVLVIVLMYTFIKIFITKSIPFLPLYLFSFATVIEVGQYFNILERLRLEQYRLLRIILGATFDMKDILCYFIGAVLLLLGQRFEKKVFEKR